MTNNKGAISVLLCGIFLAVIIIVGAAADASSLAVANAYAKRIDYLASESVLAEYDRNLFDDYGLMAFNGGSDEIEERITDYADKMSRLNVKNKKSTVFFDIELDDVEVDCGGQNLAVNDIFIAKVREDQKYRAVDIAISALSSLTKGVSGIGSKVNSAKNGLEEEKSQQTNNGSGSGTTTGENVSSEIRESVNVNNNKFNIDDGPSDRVLKSERVIEALPSEASSEGGSISGGYSLGQEAQLISLASKSSSILDSIKSSFSATGDKAVMLEYITHYFKNALKSGDDMGETFFTNEMEYIIKGYLSDKNNYKHVKNEIFLLRTALNIAHIYSDSEKNQLTLEAASIAGEFAPAVQMVIATAWAAAEAKEDIQTIYTGGSVPLVKSSDDWKLSFSGIYSAAADKAGVVSETGTVAGSLDADSGSLGSNDESSSGGGSGLDYEGYLQLLLLTVSRDNLIKRSMDLITINMKGRYDIQFDLRNCIIKYSEKAEFNRIPFIPSVLPGIIEDNAMSVEGEYEYS